MPLSADLSKPVDPVPTSVASEGSPRPAVPFWRRWLGSAIKILLAFGLLYFVRHKIDLHNLKRLFFSSPEMLGLALVTITTQLFIGTQRLRWLLAAQNINISYRDMLRLTYLGAFFDSFLVTSVGGDAVKAVYLARETQPGYRTQAVSTLVLDRLMGLLGLLTMALLMALLHLEVMWGEEFRLWFLLLLLVSGALFAGTLMLFSHRVYQWRPMQWLIGKLPFGGTINRAYGSLQQFRHRLGAVATAWALSLLVHTAGVGGGYWLALGLGLEPSFVPFCVAWFIANFVCSFAPIMGIGFGQYMYDKIFMVVANMDVVGATLATALQLTSLLVKSPGLFAWLITRESGKPPSAVVAGKDVA